MEYRNQHLQSGCLCTVSISPVRSEHSRRTHSIINNFSLVVDARPRYKKHPCPSCCAVAQHRMDRGACVYCRLLSVLLMQIIKFGGKLVVNPRCSSIERHNFKRNKAIFCVLLLNRLHRGDRSRKAQSRAGASRAYRGHRCGYTPSCSTRTRDFGIYFFCSGPKKCRTLSGASAYSVNLPVPAGTKSWSVFFRGRLRPFALRVPAPSST